MSKIRTSHNRSSNNKLTTNAPSLYNQVAPSDECIGDDHDSVYRWSYVEQFEVKNSPSGEYIKDTYSQVPNRSPQQIFSAKLRNTPPGECIKHNDQYKLKRSPSGEYIHTMDKRRQNESVSMVGPQEISDSANRTLCPVETTGEHNPWVEPSTYGQSFQSRISESTSDVSNDCLFDSNVGTKQASYAFANAHVSGVALQYGATPGEHWRNEHRQNMNLIADCRNVWNINEPPFDRRTARKAPTIRSGALSSEEEHCSTEVNKFQSHTRWPEKKIRFKTCDIE